MEDCASLHQEFRWVRPDNLHITLRFVGGIDGDRLRDLEGRLASVSAPAFELSLDHLGTFGSGRFRRVIWLGVAGGVETAASIAAQVEQACVGAGLEPEGRPFRAHITLARARDRRGAPAPELQEPPSLDPWRPPEFILYRSKPGPGGSEYTPLRKFALGAG